MVRMTAHTEYKINIHFSSGCPPEYLGEEDPEVLVSILGALKTDRQRDWNDQDDSNPKEML